MQDLIADLKSMLTPTSTVVEIAGVPHLITHKDQHAKALPELLERIAPQRIRRTVAAHDVRGFVDYVNTYKLAGAEHGDSRIYAGPFEAARLEARLDDIQPGTPSHVTHLCTFGCPQTREWKTWTEAHKRVMNQVDFALFIETNLIDIVEPVATDLLAATLDFSNSSTGEFKSAARLKDGSTQFRWSQDNSGMEARFPDRIKLGLRVYEGLDVAYSLSARMRFRVKDGALTLWYELERPDIVQRAAYEKLLADVGERTGCAVIRAV